MQLQDVLFSKEKLARNFDETEKLYIEKIQNLQEEGENLKIQLLDAQERYLSLYSIYPKLKAGISYNVAIFEGVKNYQEI